MTDWMSKGVSCNNRKCQWSSTGWMERSCPLSHLMVYLLLCAQDNVIGMSSLILMLLYSVVGPILASPTLTTRTFVKVPSQVKRFRSW
jgi:hypothetical protein